MQRYGINKVKKDKQQSAKTEEGRWAGRGGKGRGEHCKM